MSRPAWRPAGTFPGIPGGVAADVDAGGSVLVAGDVGHGVDVVYFPADSSGVVVLATRLASIADGQDVVSQHWHERATWKDAPRS